MKIGLRDFRAFGDTGLIDIRPLTFLVGENSSGKTSLLAALSYVWRLQDACRSNDPHVIAIALVGRADVVVTADKALIEDLKDPSIMGSRRRIYKENSAKPDRIDRHIKLLRGLDCPA